jgi:DNA gyrase subunit A
MTTKEEDEIAHLVSGTTHDDVLFFTNKGRVFTVRAYEIPEGSRQSKGQAIINLINIDQGETVESVVALEEIARARGHLFMATKKGMVKKTAVKKFAKIKTNGLIAIRLASDDQLIHVTPTSGNDEIFLVTHLGKAIKFSEQDVRTMGRATRGVRGIHLRTDDYVVGAQVVSAEITPSADKRRRFFKDLLVVTEKGLGKRTPVKLFPKQKRAGVGVKVAKLTERTGNLVCAAIVSPEYRQVVLTTKKAQVIKLPLKNIKQLGRATQGVILMRFGKQNDQVAAMTCLASFDEEGQP